MEENNKFEAHALLGETPNDLRELWIEIPGDCHLHCAYCLAFENRKDFRFFKGDRFDNRNHLLTVADYIAILTEFRDGFPLAESEIAQGIKKQIAIPAAGEPFFTNRMRDYLYPIIDFCEQNDIIITVFTTGDLISDEDIKRLQSIRNIHLVIKFNSFIPAVQDKIVAKKGYTVNRGKVIEKLIAAGFNDGRLGIVTSLIQQNVDEAEQILRFARDNNLTFDMDLIISRGKGEGCNCQFDSKQELLTAVNKLGLIDEKEYGHH